MKKLKLLFVIMMTICSLVGNAQNWKEIDRTEFRVFYVNPQFTGRTFEFMEDLISENVRQKITASMKLNTQVYKLVTVYEFNEDFTKQRLVRGAAYDKAGKEIFNQKYENEPWREVGGRIAFFSSVAKQMYNKKK